MSVSFNLHPKQTEFLLTTATECLYGGATRGGKSYVTRAALTILSELVPGLQSFIYRKYYDDVIKNHMTGEDGFKAILHDKIQNKDVFVTENTVRWPNGSLITLGHLATEEAKEKGRGIPSHILVFEEAGQIDPGYMKFLRVWNTMPEAMKDKLPDLLRPLFGDHLTDAQMRNYLPKTWYTSNPSGPAMPYFRREFVKAAPKGQIFYHESGTSRVYIEAKVEDNPSEDKDEVVKRVLGLGDANEADALLNANWDAPLGDFFPQYDERRHVVPTFEPPEHWFKYISFDWGSLDPFAVIWWAVSDGEPFTGPLGRELWFPRGALIAYREWYGCDPADPKMGLQMRNEEIAAGILDRTRESTSGLVIADPVPFRDMGQSYNGKSYRVADTFSDAGVKLTLGNCARIFGWNQIRGRLIGVKYSEELDAVPLIYFCECMRNLREYLPTLGRNKSNPEDAQEKGEATHICDAARIGVATKPIVLDRPKDKAEDFRAREPMTPRTILKRLRRGEGRRTIYRI